MSFEGRRVSEPSALRALSHPLRLRLIELLQQAGPLTATEARPRTSARDEGHGFTKRIKAIGGIAEFLIERLTL